LTRYFFLPPSVPLPSRGISVGPRFLGKDFPFPFRPNGCFFFFFHLQQRIHGAKGRPLRGSFAFPLFPLFPFSKLFRDPFMSKLSFLLDISSAITSPLRGFFSFFFLLPSGLTHTRCGEVVVSHFPTLIFFFLLEVQGLNLPVSPPPASPPLSR